MLRELSIIVSTNYKSVGTKTGTLDERSEQLYSVISEIMLFTNSQFPCPQSEDMDTFKYRSKSEKQ